MTRFLEYGHCCKRLKGTSAIADPIVTPATLQEQRRLTASAVRVTALLNGGAVVVAGLYFGQELLVPLVLAGLLAFVLAPLARLLQRAYLPHVVASLLAVVLAFVILGLLSTVVGGQLSTLISKAPEYEANIIAKWELLLKSSPLVSRFAAPLRGGLGETASPLSLAEQFARPLLGPVATAAVVLVFTLVILLYSDDLRDRFVRLVGRHDLHRTIFALNDAGHRLSRYFLSQLTINAAFGLWIGGSLALAGLPSPILLGLIAMLMRFVPFVGTFIGLAAPLALAVAVSPSWSLAFVVLAIFAVSEIVVSQVVEPLLYGHSTGISPVAVLVATSFWTLLWGFVGLLIATPLTVCLVVIGRNVTALAFLDVLFGSESPLLPAETFYQRALEGRSMALLKAARAHVEEVSRADYYDRVALPGLVLAQQDRGGDDPEFVEPVHAQFQLLLDELAPEPAGGDADWQRPGAILCIPARGDFDDLAAAMAAQALREAGFGAEVVSNAVLDNAPPDDTAAPPRLCCLSVIETDAGAATVRFFIRRIERKMPDTKIVIGLWGAAGGSELLAALRAEGGDEHLILSIGELVAYARAISAQGEMAQ
ncbi:MAG: AI-2E family transporter [Acetobacteraceae bacterium]|nr:AI-2E family transporter [Acetobacteraceae bacterium]